MEIKPAIISITQLKSFLGCQKYYHNKYVLKIKEPIVGSALVLGSATHYALEKFGASEGAVSPSEVFRSKYDELIEQFNKEGRPVVWDEWTSYAEEVVRGSEMVERYAQRNDVFSQSKFYPETPFITKIKGVENVYLYGIIDGICGNDIYEYKTTKAEPPNYFIDWDIQLIGYAYARKYGLPVNSEASSYPDNIVIDEDMRHLFGVDTERVRYVALHSLYKGRKKWHVNDLYYDMTPTQEKFQFFEETVKTIVGQMEYCRETDEWVRNLKDPTTTPCRMCAYKSVCWDSEQPPIKQKELTELKEEKQPNRGRPKGYTNSSSAMDSFQRKYKKT